MLIDNREQLFVDELRRTLRAGSRVAIAASHFSIYAYQALKQELEAVEELRFIFTEPTFVQEETPRAQREFYIPRLGRERSLLGSEYEIQLRNELTQRAIAQECADWIRRKVRFRSARAQEDYEKFALVDGNAYLPLKGFTTVDLGLDKSQRRRSSIVSLGMTESRYYVELFEEYWQDEAQLEEVTEQLITSISSVYRENEPELIYFITLYHIFREFLEELSEDVLPIEATGFRDSVVWQRLYRFQQDAALGIIAKLEQYNGCILADSVGLGKTFTALSVIKYYQERNKSVLVLCPKKLYDNWDTYRGNYLNNPLAADRLNYDILYHSDLGRERGMSNGTKLENVRWGNYDLVVIDESHNFRNGGRFTGEDEAEEGPRENRYLRLLNRVIRTGIKTKVLMLSATPVNNGFRDLKNQLQLAYEGDAAAFDERLGMGISTEETFRQAQSEYTRWSKLPEAERTTETLQRALPPAFFELLDRVTIARSRRHIERYYDTTEVGAFPERLPVCSRRPQLTLDSAQLSYTQLYELISQLNLALYTPSDFIQPSRWERYLDPEARGSRLGLSQHGRERGIRRLMCINLLKRLESSMHAFRLTLQRLEELLRQTLGQIAQLQQGASTQWLVRDWAVELDLEEQEDELLVGGGKQPIDLRDIDYLSWQRYLEADLSILEQLLQATQSLTPSYDAKLQCLLSDVERKVSSPINEGNRKVIIFTAFADTAEYLYSELAPLLHSRHGLHSVLITGGVEARSTLRLPRGQRMSFATALTLFSPRSKDKASSLPQLEGEIDILFATDCISEGQNLQDCDYLINYDIHWNPVRLIQRFGRIDRIGSPNERIQMVNYWPDMQLDAYIKLKARVENRMKVTVLTATGDDNLLLPEEQGDLEYRRRQLERLQTEVVDLEEMGTGISILDLGLGQYRQDLLDYVKRHGDLERCPLGLHALVPSSPERPPGAIYVLKNRNQAIDSDRRNQLHPFYLVYITEDGQLYCDHLSPRRLLGLMRLACWGQAAPLDELCLRFNQETQDGRQMQHYSQLLHRAVQSIIAVREQSDLSSFLDGEQGALFTQPIQGLDDFELIAFLVIK